MTTNNPSSKSIDIRTQAGLNLLKIKANYYGHYADFLLVPQLIEEIERLREISGENTSLQAVPDTAGT